MTLGAASSDVMARVSLRGADCTRATALRKNEAVSLVDRLIDRYEAGAIVRVAPYVGDDGETLRWFVQIDGKDVDDVDVAVRDDPDRPGKVVMLLVSGEEELEIMDWSKERYPYGPAVVGDTLGGLRRRTQPN